MQSAMLRLDALLRRRKRAVLALWALVLLIAVPFSMRQSEDLSSGGFGVPGSQSAAVDGALERFPGAQGAQLAAVLIPQAGATPEQLDAAIARLGAAAGPIEDVELTADGRAQAERAAPAGQTIVVPLRAT